MAEIGVLSGLAQNLGFDQRINDIRYQEREKQRALADVSAQQQLFAQDLDYQNAANSHDAPIIKDFAKSKINEIGKFVRENPDWQYNVDKRLMLNQMKKDLKDNSELKRGLASDNSYKSYFNYDSTKLQIVEGEDVRKYYLEDRSEVKYKDISPHVIHALIATEDERFLLIHLLEKIYHL